MPPTPHPLRLGNDVVDLDHPRVRSMRDRPRFRKRVLSDEERAWVAHGDPDWERRLWAAWAAKECAFKVACKWPGPRPVFRHAAFRSRLALVRDDTGLAEVHGSVEAEGGHVRIAGWVTDTVVHLAGTGGEEGGAGSRMEIGVERLPSSDPDAPSLEALRDRFTPREWEGVHSLASAWARLLVRTRLRSHLGGDATIEVLTSRRRPGRTPPRILVGGVPRPDIDVSLSHHGAWVGWALLLPRTEVPPPADGNSDQKPGR